MSIATLSKKDIEKSFSQTLKSLTEKELIALGLFTEKEVLVQDPEKPLYQKYFMHGVNHHMGLDVHDVGNYYSQKKMRNLKPNMVFTIERLFCSINIVHELHPQPVPP